MNINYSQIKENALIYGESIQAYNEYLDSIAYLIKILSLPNNAISESMILRELTNMGIFSNDKNLRIQYGKKDDIVGFWGMHVVDGTVSCRHIANFQSDVIKRNFVYSVPFYCSLSSHNFQNTGSLPVNHAINLISYNGVYYGYDVGSNKLFHFINGRKMEELFSNQPLFAYYRPELKFVQNNELIQVISYDMGLFKKMEKMPTISQEEFDFIAYYTKKAITNNAELFEAFHESSKKYIKRITKRKGNYK